MSQDMRRFATQTNRRLLIGFVVILLVVGLGLIALIFGPSSAAVGLVCLLGALVPVGLIWLVLTVMGWIVKKVNGPEE
ncbi:MAG: hypothetical protein ACKOC5_09640 [Chloroflexota bacterium]